MEDKISVLTKLDLIIHEWGGSILLLVTLILGVVSGWISHTKFGVPVFKGNEEALAIGGLTFILEFVFSIGIFLLLRRVFSRITIWFVLIIGGMIILIYPLIHLWMFFLPLVN